MLAEMLLLYPCLYAKLLLKKKTTASDDQNEIIQV